MRYKGIRRTRGTRQCLLGRSAVGDCRALAARRKTRKVLQAVAMMATDPFGQPRSTSTTTHTRVTRPHLLSPLRLIAPADIYSMITQMD